MLLARIVGRAVCTMKIPDLLGVHLLIVQPLNKQLEPEDTLQVAADVVEAGPGDLCVLTRSREASMAMRDEWFVPVDLAVIGVVDELDLHAGFDTRLQTGWNRFT